MKKGKRKRIQAELNKKGLLTTTQAKKLKIIKQFIEKHPNVADPGVVKKELYEMTFDEFKSVFARSALQLTNFKSTSSALRLIKSSYLKLIVNAVRERKEMINIEGIRMIQFRVEYRALVIRHCKEKNIILD